jgi:hypothetical protein
VQAHTGRLRLFEKGFTTDRNSGLFLHGSRVENPRVNREALRTNTSTEDP